MYFAYYFLEVVLCVECCAKKASEVIPVVEGMNLYLVALACQKGLRSGNLAFPFPWGCDYHF